MPGHKKICHYVAEVVYNGGLGRHFGQAGHDGLNVVRGAGVFEFSLERERLSENIYEIDFVVLEVLQAPAFAGAGFAEQNYWNCNKSSRPFFVLPTIPAGAFVAFARAIRHNVRVVYACFD